jgi:hypothetical protein
MIPAGYCQCGCGELAAVPNRTDPGMGRYAGVPLRFKRGHRLRVNMKGARGSEVPWWKGGRTKLANGYISLQVGEGHPMAGKYGRAYEHRVVMADKLGRTLLPDEVVHHINGIRDDNRPENLMLMENSAAHQLLHRQLRSGS